MLLDTANLVPRVFSVFKMAAGRREYPGVRHIGRPPACIAPRIVGYFVLLNTVIQVVGNNLQIFVSVTKLVKENENSY